MENLKNKAFLRQSSIDDILEHELHIEGDTKGGV